MNDVPFVRERMAFTYIYQALLFSSIQLKYKRLGYLHVGLVYGVSPEANIIITIIIANAFQLRRIYTKTNATAYAIAHK